jgi:hypothetical protein
MVDCDPRKVMCERAAPACDDGTVPSVEGSCYGPCVKIDNCACDEAADCPEALVYTCHLSAHHCGPFL